MTRLLPSPATAVALVALVAALGGSAAALPGKRSVKRDDIAPNAVTGKAVKRNSLTGADIRERRLGEVPRAAAADSADSAASAEALAGLTHFGPFTLAEGEQRELVVHGPVRVFGRCEDDAAQTKLSAIAVTSVPDSVVAGDDVRTYFDPNTPELDRTFERPGAIDNAGGGPSPSDGFDDQFWLRAPGGEPLYGTIGSTADADNQTCTVFGWTLTR
jgi:hypothetical protein